MRRLRGTDHRHAERLPGVLGRGIHGIHLVSPLGGFATGASFRLDGGAVAMGPFDLHNR